MRRTAGLFEILSSCKSLFIGWGPDSYCIW